MQTQYLAPPPQRTSNVCAILALTFGIIAIVIGWVPICGSLPALCFALAGIPLGAVGLSAARKNPLLGMGLPVTGLVLSCLGLLLSAAATLVPVLFVKEVAEAAAETRAEEEQRRAAAAASPSPYLDAATYAVESPSHLAGTGFIIETDTGLYAVTAQHPFDDETPTSFIPESLDPSGEVPLGGVVHHGVDLLVLGLAPGAAPNGPTLRYPGPMPVKAGDRVVVLGRSGPLTATVSSAPISVIPGSARLDAPAAVAGLSGAPVVLEATGTPIGVLVSADDPDNATVVNFLKLRLPDRLTSAPKPRPSP